MDNLDALRLSALAQVNFSTIESDQLRIHEIPNLQLYQIAAWPETLDAVRTKALEYIGATGDLKNGGSVSGDNAALLSVEPLKFWLIGAEPPTLNSQEGATLDLSHSRTHLRLEGPGVTNLLNKHISLDLRPQSFPEGHVASTGLHHVGITLWRNNDGFDLFIPRAFAVTISEMLFHGLS